MPAKLTKAFVDRLAVTEPGVRVLTFDSELVGFGVRTTASARTFFVQYRAGTGRTAPKRRVSLGQYGPLTVEQARRMARLVLAEVAQGSDPAANRDAARKAPTIGALGVEYLSDVDARRKPSTAVEYRRLWKKHVNSALGGKRVADVTPSDVAKLHRTLSDTPYIANRVLALLGAFFTYSERQGIRTKNTNPAHEVSAFNETSRERFLTPAEVARLGAALTTAEVIGLTPAPVFCRKATRLDTVKYRPKSAGTPIPANPFAVAAIRFLLLTGWREGEALTLKWADVNLDNGRATLGDTKTGKSQRAIGAPARLLLASLPRTAGCPFIFPGRSADSHLVDISRLWYSVRHAANLDDVRLHDLRHSFASVSASSGGSLLLIGRLLGHRDVATTAKYAHLFDDPIRAAADSAADQLAAWLDGNIPEATVVRQLR